jgi:lysophospholipase L1-like esterase
MQFIWFCAAGYSYFGGIGLIILATFLLIFNRNLYSRLSSLIFLILAIFLIFLSATPLPWWFYTVWAVSTLAYFIISIFQLKPILYLRMILRIIALVLSVTALLIELPFILKPSFPSQKFNVLYVIGDSVSAGIGGLKEQTWPKIFEKSSGADVVNLSESGATVSSAMRQTVQINYDSENVIVLLEIGGNDLFAPTPCGEFKRDLEQLVKTAKGSKRTVAMLELPTLPWQIQYTKIQRELAKKLSVILIPKRIFVSVLSQNGATRDLAHLSAKGHEVMSQKIWEILKESISKTKKR